MPESNGKNEARRKKIIYAAGIGIILFLVISPLIITAIANKRAIIITIDSRYYRVKNFFIIGSSLCCMRDPDSFRNRYSAFINKPEKYSPVVIPINNVRYIEILPEEKKEDTLDSAGTVHKKNLGKFRINAAGNNGFLYLVVQNDRLYGSIRFPGWGKGAAEPLKGVYIGYDKIRFTRSVTSAYEKKKTGSSRYFIQQYYGKYSSNGKVIHGYYVTNHVKKPWEAYKFK